MSSSTIASLSGVGRGGRAAAAALPAASLAEPEVASGDAGVDLGLDFDFQAFDDDNPFAGRSDMPIGDLGGDAAASAPVKDENGSGTGTFVVGASGNQGIDGLLSGVAWSGGAITYSFPDSSADYQAGHPELPFFGSQLTAAQQLAAHFALNDATYTQPVAAVGFSVEGFTNLGITWTSSEPSGTIRLINSNKPGTAYAYYPSTGVWGGDAFFGPSGSSPVMGNYHWHTVLHEIGHSLGLKHGQDTGGFGALPTGIDSMEYSVMTYRSYVGHPGSGGYTNETYGYAQTYMMYDIAALQYMYGADFTNNSGNTVYSWNPGSGNTVINGSAAITPGGNRIFMTVWDGGGIDTYDASAYTTGVFIDLNPGGYSLLSSGQRAFLGGSTYARGNVFNALQYNGDARSLIENATGGSGNDTLYGNAANNVLTGNAGNDYLWASSGNDTIYGGDGNDTLSGSSGNDWVQGDAGNDYVYGDSGDDYVFGNDGNDTMYGSDGNDWVYAGHGNTIDGIADGGTGTDGLYYGYFGLNGYTFDDGLDQIRFGTTVVGTMVGFETIYAGTGNDIMISDGTGHTYYGLGGDDTLFAGLGAETMYGGTGIDTADMTLFDGAYSYNMVTGLTNYGGELYLEFERVIMGDGNDTVIGTANNDTIDGGLGSDSMQGGNGDDVYYVNSASDLVVEGVFGGSDWVLTSANNLTLAAWVENMQLLGSVAAGTGNGLNNIMYGNGAKNTLDGGGGADSLYGFGGNDTYLVDSLDSVFESAGGGKDTVKAGFTYILGANLENLTLTGGAAINGTGNGAKNTIKGNSGNNQLDGAGGNDKLQGGTGSDTLLGGAGADLLEGQNGSDTLDGGAGNDTLLGDVAADVLIGGAGNDQLDGGAGADTLTGNAGTDNFIYSTGSDLVTDFVDDIDALLLDDSLWGGAALSIAQVLATYASVVAGDTIFNFGGGNTLVLDSIANVNLLADDIVFV